MLLQNGAHNKNSARTDSITSEELINVFDESEAAKYLRKMLKEELMNKLKSAETTLVRQFEDKESDDLSRKILLATDVFTAVEMMRVNKMFFGKGQF